MVLLGILIATATLAQDKVTISGQVRDAKTGEDLIGATLFLQELGTGGVSNVYGFYSLTVPSGDYSLTVSFIGYEPVTQKIVLSEDLKVL